MKGWFRLGVVLSVIWCISFSSYVLSRYTDFVEECATKIWETRNEAKWAIVGQDDALFSCSLKEDLPEDGKYGPELIKSKMVCRAKWTPCLLCGVGTVIAAWMIALAMIWSYKWVRRGFVQKKT